MRKLFLLCVIVFASTGNELFAQTVSAIEQNINMGRGVNVIGYDDALWKDYSKFRFREKYFKMITEAGFSHTRVNLHPFKHLRI